MKLSFGMIFSIILIIFFIALAFYVIPKFLDWQDSAKVGIFINELQTDVEKMWKADQGSQELEYSLPTEMEEVCFRDSELYFKPIGVGGSFDYTEIGHVDVSDFCIEVVDGKVSLTIKKDFGRKRV